MSIPNPFAPATRVNRRAKIALIGLPGAGKTLTALFIARALVGPHGRIAMIDTEAGSGGGYQGWMGLEFEPMQLDRHSPQSFIENILAAGEHKYDALVIDSLSHLHSGTEGALEMAHKSSTGWMSVSPQVQRVFRHILEARFHVISTLRQKDDYVVERNDKGKMEPRLVGTSPVSKKGTEYEFDVILRADTPGVTTGFTVSKSRIPYLPTGTHIQNPTGEEVADPILRWYLGAEDYIPPPPMEELIARKERLVEARVIDSKDRPGVSGGTEADRRIIDAWLRDKEALATSLMGVNK